jgi:hypothetical protein
LLIDGRKTSPEREGVVIQFIVRFLVDNARDQKWVQTAISSSSVRAPTIRSASQLILCFDLRAPSVSMGYNTQLLLDASEGGIRKEIRKSASDQHARTAVRSHGPLVRDGGKAAYGVLRRNPVGRFEARQSRRATWFARASGAP